MQISVHDASAACTFQGSQNKTRLYAKFLLLKQVLELCVGMNYMRVFYIYVQSLCYQQICWHRGFVPLAKLYDHGLLHQAKASIVFLYADGFLRSRLAFYPNIYGTELGINWSVRDVSECKSDCELIGLVFVLGTL